MKGSLVMIRTSIQDRIRQTLDTVEYNESFEAFIISAKYWRGLEPDTYNLYSSLPILKAELIKELVERWG